MAYSLEALKELIKNSLSVKELPIKYQKKILKTLKAPDIAERRRLYFLLLEEKAEMEMISHKIEKGLGEYVATINQLAKKI